MNKVKDNYIFLALFVLTMCGALVRIIGLGEYYYSYDEMWHIYVAKQPTLSQLFHINLLEDGHPVLPYILWHYLLQAWDNPWSARLPSLIFGILSIPLAYVMGKAMFNNKHGALFAAFLVAFGKVMIEQSQVVRGYSLMMFFAILSFWAVYKYANRPSVKYLLIYFISMSIAVLSEFAVATLIVFSSSYLLWSAWCAKKYSHIVLSLLLNLAILAYLLWFQHILYSVGALDYGENIANRSKTFLIYFYLCWVSFYNGISASYIFSLDNIIGLALLLFEAVVLYFGFKRIIIRKSWVDVAFVASFLLVGLLLYCINGLPAIYARRNIGIIIPAAVLLYHGGIYMAERYQRLQHFSITRNFCNLLMATSIIFTLKFLVDPADSRKFYNEFSYRYTTLDQYFAEIDSRVKPGDIIITQKIISHFFEDRFGKGEIEKHDKYEKLTGYKVPIYTYNEDVRVCSGLCLNMYGFQRQINAIHTTEPNAGRGNIVWLTSLFSGNNPVGAFRPAKDQDMDISLEKLESSKLSEDRKTFWRDLISFQNWLDKSGVKKIERYDCSHKVGSKCNLLYVMYGVKAEVLFNKMKTEQYNDPFSLFYKRK